MWNNVRPRWFPRFMNRWSFLDFTVLTVTVIVRNIIFSCTAAASRRPPTCCSSWWSVFIASECEIIAGIFFWILYTQTERYGKLSRCIVEKRTLAILINENPRRYMYNSSTTHSLIGIHFKNNNNFETCNLT